MKSCPSCASDTDGKRCEFCGYSFSKASDAGDTVYAERDTFNLTSGDLIADRYRVVRELGRGGMGVVYLVEDMRLNERLTALKIIHAFLMNNAEATQRFSEEVAISLELSHPNIIRVYTIDAWEGTQFYTMEYLGGETLRQRLNRSKGRRPPLGLEETGAVISPLLEALSYAHQFTIHRDIKPENIMLTGDFPDVQVKVLDFGIARTMSPSRLTQTAHAMGTAYYMAPEQMAKAGGVDHRADLYSVGMVIYEMLTGEMAVGVPEMPSQMVPSIPESVDRFITRLLQRDPEKRFASAAKANAELKAIAASASGRREEPEKATPIDGEPPAKVTPRADSSKKSTQKTSPEPPETPRPLAPVKKKPNRSGIWLVLLLLIALAAGGGWFALNSGKAPMLTVKTEPAGADIVIDGGRVGASPVTVKEMTAGVHSVKASLARYQDHEEKVFIQSDQPSAVSIALEPQPIGDAKITSDPSGAVVFVDGKNRGETPLALADLPKGQRTVRLEKEGFDSWEGPLSIVPLETVQLDRRLVSIYGQLKVDSEPPGATVELDKKAVGKTPLTLDKVEKGKHRLSVSATGFDEWQDTIGIRQEQMNTVSVDLKTIYGQVAVTSEPSGALVAIDGDDVGKTPLTAKQVKKGSRKVVVTKTGYDQWSKAVTVAAGTAATIEARLVSSFGGVTVTSDPGGADVYIDGGRAGRTPLTLDKVRKGSVGVRVSKDGYKDWRDTVSVSSGGVTAVEAELKKKGLEVGDKWTDKALGMTFAAIPAGSFMMGSPAGEPGRYDDEKQHRVTLTKGFWMQTTEVTQGQWKSVMGINPSRFRSCGDDCPVEQVSWNDVQEFIRKINEKTGGRYRLPTESEWEYAARAGTTTPFSTGQCLSTDQANYDGNNPQAGCSKGQYRQTTVKVGSFSPNLWGLYDMHGNVWEWVQDWNGDYPTGAVTDPTGPSGGAYRVLRGGSWFRSARYCRSANRLSDAPGGRYGSIGFRLARAL